MILVPRSVARQWQEELWEKFALNVPFYDGVLFTDVFYVKTEPQAENPWDSYPMILASSQLAKRRDRRQQLLRAELWDLVIVDEAHHARRREFSTDRYRPNRLLELLAGARGEVGLKGRTKASDQNRSPGKPLIIRLYVAGLI